MSNPRRISLQLHNHHSASPLSNNPQPPARASFSSIAAFLKRPSAFPFVLSLFLLLTWLCLRVQRAPASATLLLRAQLMSGLDADADANLARFSVHSLISRDRRGWLFNPISVAHDKGIHGGAQICKSIHAGEIRPGCFRGNHRHHTCNETFLIWGAETKFRLENPLIEGKGYAEVRIGADEVAVAASPSGSAHALINVDTVRTTFFLGCQDTIIDNNSSTTDYKVWGDLLTS
ncbi:uncharacterized protein LOC110018194 [Phalaenopsis equestris]|uniref:uncharacterized protein LOC110018194 n=1 Tax=Phalaenopsis equestris TaxID=78828 RepID=UPI0009E4DBB7|nr:uncharacterized protein LOC110018194 [Phalaenopsis equestris]XP_020571090.1 uncharacterized protein LOC110018194 [Phalaenopsis equestris]